MMKYIVNIIAFISAFVLTAFAGWNTELFDGESKRWGHGYERAQQCSSAVVERSTAEGYPTNIPARRWGSSWTLSDVKQDYLFVGDTIGWVDKSQTNASALYATNNWPYLYASNMLTNAGAPSNWFDEYIHWGAVTHSNGWQYLDEIINELTIRFERPYINDGKTLTNSVYSGEGTGYSAVEAENNAITNAAWTNDAPAAQPRNTGAVLDEAPGGETHTAYIWMEYNVFSFPPPCTNYDADVSVYMAVEAYGSYDAGVSGFVEDKWNLVTNLHYTAGETNIEFRVGPTNAADWVGFPAAIGSKGWRAYESEPGAGRFFWLWWDFAITNGFEYVE